MLLDAANGLGQRREQVGGRQRELAFALASHIAGQAVQINGSDDRIVRRRWSGIRSAFPCRPCAQNPATMPVRMSPMPPVAMPGLPLWFTHTRPSGSAVSVRCPLRTSTSLCCCANLRATPMRSFSTSAIGPADQARHLAGMRRQHQRVRRAIQLLRRALEGVQAVRVDHHRHAEFFDQRAHELRGLGVTPDARAESDHRLALNERIHAAVLESTQRDRSGLGLIQRLGHQFGHEASDGRKHRARTRDRDQSRSRAQCGHARHRGSARLSQRSADHEHVSEAALVGLGIARREQSSPSRARWELPGRGWRRSLPRESRWAPP